MRIKDLNTHRVSLEEEINSLKRQVTTLEENKEVMKMKNAELNMIIKDGE